jgi:hypothetical protein
VVIFHLSASPQILDKNKEKEGKGSTEGKRELSLPLIPLIPHLSKCHNVIYYLEKAK